MYKIQFTKKAEKAFHKLPRNLASRVRQKIEEIAANPYDLHPNVIKLKEHPGYRIRIGDWRIIYLIQDEKMIILVLKIATRGKVYR
ncbi:MAG: type II toxin-antitoxin system RelE/ParE family toxin [Chloroflexi bacterium]|nr:type II toxin-antitoxin system RelE/ParE family toxin [Chloroflexota bacterium]